MSPHSFARDFVKRLQDRNRSVAAQFPAYDYHDAGDLASLVTRCVPRAFHLGTGASIYTGSLLPAIASAKHEVILVTCFWAKSRTLDALRETLEGLAARRQQIISGADADRAAGLPPLRIRICLSSTSFFQKLFHTASPDGYVYPSSSWPTELGLPDARTLKAARIDLGVKSIFFLPFSVMHPKLVIIDRQRAFLPSCNVSWEAWLEGCVEVTGDAVAGLLSFYARTWERSLDPDGTFQDTGSAPDIGLDTATSTSRPITSPAGAMVSMPEQSLSTIILPSAHHRNPRFRPFPWQTAAPPPPTPLNICLVQLFDLAKRSIYIQTPDLTSPAVFPALLAALRRGVDIQIVTSRDLKPMEQLLTAGTQTSWCIKRFVKRYKALLSGTETHLPHRRRGGASETEQILDRRSPIPLEEGSLVRAGSLRISYFHSLRPIGRESDPEQADEGEEPVHSHFKVTIVDDEYSVLGSGNMDRASWYTSQELGVLFEDAHFATSVKRAVEGVLEGRTEVVFDSGPRPTA